MMRVDWRRLMGGAAMAFLAAAGLSACGSNPVSDAVAGIVGDDEEGEGDEANAPEEEERISILALENVLEADPRFAGMEVPVPPSYTNASWPSPGGEADHTLHHLTASVELESIWKADVGKAGERAVLTAPPVAADGKLFVIDAATNVSSYDMETGELAWRTELTPDIDEKFRVQEIFTRPKAAEIGFGGGVAYENGRIFVSSGFGFIAALDAATGEELWRTKTEAPVRQPLTAFRGAVYAVTNVNRFVALSQATGEELWDYQSFEESARILSSASPAAAGDLVLAPFSSGEIVAILTDTGRPVWNDTLAKTTQLTALSTLNDIAGSPVIDRGLIYVVSHAGQLTAIDIRTGQRVWQVPLASLQMPWVAGDFIYAVSVDSELVCVSRNEGAVVWVAQLPRYRNEKKRRGRIAWAGPVLAGDHLILVSTEGDIIKASPQNGAIMGQEEIADSFIIPPIVANETIFVLSKGGKLIALK